MLNHEYTSMGTLVTPPLCLYYLYTKKLYVAREFQQLETSFSSAKFLFPALQQNLQI